MEVSARLKNAPMSAQKCRLVANMIRNHPVDQALNVLEFTNKKSAKLIKKLLESAVANAEHNDGADIDELRVSHISVDQSTGMKRIKPRAKGRADRIIKHTCHITLKVSDEE